MTDQSNTDGAVNGSAYDPYAPSPVVADSYSETPYTSSDYSQSPAATPYSSPSYTTPSYGSVSYASGSYGSDLVPGAQQPGAASAVPQPQTYSANYTQAYGPNYYPARAQTNVWAIVSLVCSLAGIFTGFTAIMGIVGGHIARKQIRTSGEEGDGLALAGLIIGYIVAGAHVAFWVVYFGILAFIWLGFIAAVGAS